MAVKTSKKHGPKFKEVDLEEVERLAKTGISEDSIARLIGMHPSTWYEKKQNNPDISDAVKRGRAHGELIHMQRIEKELEKGNTALLIFKAKAIYGWRERDVTELVGKDGAALTVEHVLIPPEERKKKLEELRQLTEAEEED